MAIEILNPTVINQIAAGEVIERPAQLIKELIENSLDAGSSKIEIQCEKSGRDFSVSDDGGGISADDLPLSVVRHATSKIAKIDDLWRLKTFGFRGEALASAAAISKLQIISSTGNSPMVLSAEFGQTATVVESSRAQGTTVRVTELFSNIPARLKFLKTPAIEVAAIKTVVKAQALAHPEVSFKFVLAGEMQLFWPIHSNRQERVESVLGVQLFPGALSQNDLRAEVYLCSPKDSVPHSRNIWIYAQGRHIQDITIRASMLDAYRGLLMHGQYPVAAIFVDVPPEFIDVNMHPAKIQVKFQNSSDVFRIVQRACRAVLEQAPWRAQSQPVDALPNFQLREPVADNQISMGGEKVFEKIQYQNKSFYAPQENYAGFKIADLNALRIEPSPALASWGKINVIGQLGQTYILGENQTGLIVIDQHAAHERVLYERLFQNHRRKQTEIQTFLLPLPMKVSNSIIENLSQLDLQSWGVTAEVDGPESIQILAAPAMIKEVALQRTLEKVFNDFETKGYSVADEKALGEIFASMACHSAVRAGQTLSVQEMQELLQQMDEFPLTSFCPHGRPVSVERSFAHLEREFGRRV